MTDVYECVRIKIKYKHDDAKRIEKIPQGDWIDLRADETVELKKGEFKLIPLGVAMELPKGYEAHVAPRSSTFKNFKIIQTNATGIIDESFKGNENYWFFPAYAVEDTVINRGDRICQFRIMENAAAPVISPSTVKTTENGSTGIK